MKYAMSLMALAALAATAPAYAAGARYNAEHMTRVAPDNRVFASSIFARAAYYYGRGFAPDRSVNVTSFTNPSTGIYCIKPGTSMGARFPLVSIDWAESFGEALQAFVINTSTFSDCPAGNFEVQTWDISTPSAPVVTSNVAFDWVVP
jgi:hypothetical protein